MRRRRTMMMMMGRRSPTRENVTGRKCILRPPSRVISGLRIILFSSTWTCIKWDKFSELWKPKKVNKCHDIWPQLLWWEKTLLVPDARNGTRCRPSSRVGQGAPGHHHDDDHDHDHDALGVSDYGYDGGKIDDDITSRVVTSGDWNQDNASKKW